MLLLHDPFVDHRWLTPIFALFPHASTVAWPAWSSNDSLEIYAEKCLGEWWPTADASAPQLFVAFGFSSPIAWQLAARLHQKTQKPSALLVIGGIRRTHLFPAQLRREWLVAKWLPDKLLLRWIQNRWLGIPKEAPTWQPEIKELVKQSFASCTAGQAKSIVSGLLGWKGPSDLPAEIAVHQLHGRLDRILPVPSVEDATILLHGEHLLHLSHVQEVQRWIEAIARDQSLLRSRAQS